MSKLLPIIFVALLITTSFAQSASPQPADEAAILKANAAWLNAAQSQSAEKMVAMYDADAVTAGPAMPPARGLDELKKMWTSFFADQPDSGLTWTIDKIVVSPSGDIATMTATWKSNGKDETGPGVVVWRKQPDSSWKVLVDSAFYLNPR